MKKELASTLHQLITDALVDLEAARKNPDVILDMQRWFEKKIEDEPCSVCFAGAVMIGRMGLPLDYGSVYLDESTYSEEEKNKFWALDELRKGHIFNAICKFYNSSDKTKWFVAIGTYVDCYLYTDLEDTGIYAKFVKEMTAVAAELKELRL